MSTGVSTCFLSIPPENIRKSRNVLEATSTKKLGNDKKKLLLWKKYFEVTGNQENLKKDRERK